MPSSCGEPVCFPCRARSTATDNALHHRRAQPWSQDRRKTRHFFLASFSAVLAVPTTCGRAVCSGATAARVWWSKHAAGDWGGLGGIGEEVAEQMGLCVDVGGAGPCPLPSRAGPKRLLFAVGRILPVRRRSRQRNRQKMELSLSLSLSPVRVHVKHYKRQTVPAASGPRTYKDMGNGGVLECWHDSVYTFLKLCTYWLAAGGQFAVSAISVHVFTAGKLQAAKLRSRSSHFVSGRPGRRCSCKAKFVCQLLSGSAQTNKRNGYPERVRECASERASA